MNTPTPSPDARLQLHALQQHLSALRQGTLTPDQFSREARAADALLAALPERFGLVLKQLLNGLEAGASFQEASCSFDQSQLHQNLHDWLAAAQQRLHAAA